MTRNWKPKNEAVSRTAITLARIRVAERSRPSRTSGLADRRSTAVKAATRARPPAKAATVRGQPSAGCSRRTTPYASSIIAPVIVTAPITSKPPAGRSSRTGSLIRGTAAIRMSSDISTGAKNTQRQPIAVSRPPATSPSAKPPAAVPA